MADVPVSYVNDVDITGQNSSIINIPASDPVSVVQTASPNTDTTNQGFDNSTTLKQLQVLNGSQSFRVTKQGLWLGATTFATAPFRVDMTGALTATSVTISGGSVATSTLNKGVQGWSSSIVYSSASATQINWSSGSIKMEDGTVYAISSGNTGSMAALTYIYLDIAISTTVLQTTTTYSNSSGDGRVLLAAAQNNATGASVIPFGSSQPILDGTAQIAALSITAGAIAAATITAGKLSVTQLSAITADMGAITAGSIVISSTGFIRSGQTAFNTGAGYYIEANSGTPRLSIGDGTTNNSLTWDGSSLTVNGSVLTSSDVYGDGSDGNVTISVNTTLTADMFYNNLTIATGVSVSPNGFRIFVKNTLTFQGTGKIIAFGGSGGNGGDGSNSSGGTPYAGGAGGTAGAQANTAGTLPASSPGQAGDGGGTGSGGPSCGTTGGHGGTNGTNVTKSLIGTGGGGGIGGASTWSDCDTLTGASTAGTVTGTVLNTIRNFVSAYYLTDFQGSTTNFSLASGSGSGGGGLSARNDGAGGGGGGGSGATGGIVWVAAKKIVTVNGNDYIQCIGGIGGNGGNGATGVTNSSGSGGGGGGGRGGLSILIYSTLTGTGTQNTFGGNGGSPGTGGAHQGSAGSYGGDGVQITLVI